jgi:hypothetical protein
MSNDSSEARSFGTGRVLVADVGATEPADASAEFGVDWVEVGYITEEGPRFSFGKARNPVTSWQSFPEAIRNLKAAASTTVSFDLQQWNTENIVLALGGGEFVSDGAGLHTFTPPDASVNNEKALAIEGEDDGIVYRFIFRKVENQAGVEFSWTGTALSALPIVMTVLAADNDASPYIIQTDDTAVTAGS